MKSTRRFFWFGLGLLSLLALPGPVFAQVAAPAQAPGRPADVAEPAWFKVSFLDLTDDVKEARQTGKRLLLYFHQDNCPYCNKLLVENFGPPALASKVRRHFEVVSLNLFGDREVTDFSGKATTEKAFARSQRVQFTPTLLFLDEAGQVALRLNGYIPPPQFEMALDYVAARLEKQQTFGDYQQQRAPPAAGGKLPDEPWLLPSPLDLGRPDPRPLLVLFEQSACAACVELHAEGLVRPEVKALLKGFRVARVDIRSPDSLRLPEGTRDTMRAWARRLNIVYTPSLLFFDGAGKEIFRVEGYLRAFHLVSSLEYVATGAYREQPEFQRFIEARAAARRAQGERINVLQ